MYHNAARVINATKVWMCETCKRTDRQTHSIHHSAPLLLLLFLKPTSTKPQAGKLGQTYKIMVATAIYFVTMVLWKETAFPLCRAMERRWKRNAVSRVSSVIVVIRLPISCVTSMAISCHVPAVSMANG